LRGRHRSSLNFCDDSPAFGKSETGQINIVDADKISLSVNIGGEESFFALFYLISLIT
jgi:hypothetical protein